MKNIEVLIVEDEILIAETIKLYLQERGHSVVGIAISYREAVQLLEITKPDVILLDIRLYGRQSGIDVANHLRRLGRNIPYVIVSSQYTANIIEEAMHAGAAGYLTKPISKETLWSTIELAVLKQEDIIANETYIELKVSHGVQRIPLKDILYIKSDHVYVEVFCTNTKYIARYALSELVAKLEQPYFVRCHRSYIINTKKIRKYSPTRVWIGGEEIPISNKYRGSVS